MTTFYLIIQSKITEPEARRVDIMGAGFDNGWDPLPGDKRQLVSVRGL